MKAGTVRVALLRGINVSGKNKLPMAELAAIFKDAGCGDVETYIQSGNVVFRAKDPLTQRLPMLISQAIADRFGYRVPVLLRTAEQLRKVVRSNPFMRARADDKALHVVFLDRKPTANQVAALDPRRSPPDAFSVRGQEIYLNCPNGLGRSKLTNLYFDTKLDATSTVRNWKTVLQLAAMIDP